MPTAERARKERERATLRAVGEAMRDRISRAGMVPLDEERRFTRGLLISGAYRLYPWQPCPTCRAPMVELPQPNSKYGYLPSWFCYLCDFAQFADAVAEAAKLAPMIEESRRA